jgi:hypothetical protein
MTFTPIYKTGSSTDTISTVINAFAGAEPLTATFKLVGGYRTYQISPTVGDDIYAYLISVSGI